jgi:hypothetical protein
VAEPVSRVTVSREPIAPDPELDRLIRIRRLTDDIADCERQCAEASDEVQRLLGWRREMGRYLVRLRAELAKEMGVPTDA